MMKDITSVGEDLIVQIAQTSKAANVLQVQLGDLEYAQDFGVDLDFFLSEEFQFQNESFKSYLIQRLSESHVNVNIVAETIEQFFRKFTFVVGEDESSTSGGMIR